MSSDPQSSPRALERELFLSALDKSTPEERAAFLEAVCGENHGLRRRIEELLREHEEIGSFLEQPAMMDPRSGTPVTAEGAFGNLGSVAAVTEKPGDRIGRYKLLQKIGEGGCGVVYMAEQEQPVRRRVALKVIKLGMDTKSVIARFEVERQALAMMDHPNIAKVLDAGATDTGRPYFVMELVRGIRITEYCDQNNLETEQRLTLFIQVCQAIQHAHQKGIIHRDIKPSNIMVTLHDGTPIPKIIDFGIAKATEQRLTDKTLFTEFTTFIGTPAYMSPEQAEMSGLDIDTRSDIYALGVLLYELLTGKTPFDGESLMRSGLDECRRTIREEEPLRPSTRLATMLNSDLTTTARQRRTEGMHLVNSLRGDLDWVVMKCLEKDRTRRYPTANALVLDIQRYLEDEPVQARPPSNLYRLRKLLRRHRTAFAAAAIITITLVAATTVSSWLAVRATRAERLESQLRAEAEIEWKRAEQERASARLNEYVADINLAQQSLAAGNFKRAVQLLNKHRAEPGEPDLRGFEWRYLWEVSRGDEHAPFPSQGSAVHTIAFSPKGDLLAIGLREKLNIWNVQQRKLVATPPVDVMSMAFLPDGNRLITASHFSVRIWNTADWSEQTLPGSAGPIALSQDGSLLATDTERHGGFGRGSGRGSDQGGTRIWDASTWKEVRVLPATTGSKVFSPDGKSLVTDTPAGLALWSMSDGQSKIVLEDSTNLFGAGPWFRFFGSMAFSPDGKSFVAARNSLSSRGVFVLSVWDTQTGKEIGTIPESPEQIEHTGFISSLAFSPDGGTLATASWDYSIRLWDFATRKRVATLHGHLHEVWAMTFAPDGQTLVTASKDGDVKMWDKRRPPADDLLPGLRLPLAFSLDSRILAAISTNAVVFLNLTTGEPQQVFPIERQRYGPGFSRPALSRDFSTLAVGHEDGTIKLIDTATGDMTALKGSDIRIEPVALSPEGHLLITTTGGRNRGLIWWDLRSPSNPILTIDGSQAMFSPDGMTLAVFSRDAPIRLWDVPARSPRINLALDLQAGMEIAFAPDGKTIATTTSPEEAVNDIYLWETATGAALGAFTGHKQAIRSIAFSEDGKTLASSSSDSTLKLWNVATQQELLTFRNLGGTLGDLCFSPDGRWLVAGSRASGHLRLYRAQSFSETDPGVVRQ